MTTEGWKARVFEQLEPPPGGLADLRERIARQDELGERRSWRPTRRLLAGIGAVVTAAAIALLIVATSRAQLGSSTQAEIPFQLQLGAMADSHPALVSQGLVPDQAQPVVIPSSKRKAMAALQVVLDRQDVVFYWVSSAPPQPEPRRP